MSQWPIIIRGSILHKNNIFNTRCIWNAGQMWDWSKLPAVRLRVLQYTISSSNVNVITKCNVFVSRLLYLDGIIYTYTAWKFAPLTNIMQQTILKLTPYWSFHVMKFTVYKRSRYVYTYHFALKQHLVDLLFDLRAASKTWDAFF